jgi:hypothetical protein
MLGVFVATVTPAAAHPPPPPPPEPHGEILADLGLSVIHAGYEHPVGPQLSVAVTAGVFGTYFLPWFGVGDNVIGFGGGLRATWFGRPYSPPRFDDETNRGFYVAPYLRVQRVSGRHDDMAGTGLGLSAGVFAGWAFGISKKLDLRLGVGAQYIYQYIDTHAGRQTSSTPFVALDIVVGYRLRWPARDPDQLARASGTSDDVVAGRRP